MQPAFRDTSTRIPIDHFRVFLFMTDLLISTDDESRRPSALLLRGLPGGTRGRLCFLGGLEQPRERFVDRGAEEPLGCEAGGQRQYGEDIGGVLLGPSKLE